MLPPVASVVGAVLLPIGAVARATTLYIEEEIVAAGTSLQARMLVDQPLKPHEYPSAGNLQRKRPELYGVAPR